MSKIKLEIKDKINSKLEKYVKVRNSVKTYPKAISLFLLRILWIYVAVPFACYFLINFIFCNLIECINLNGAVNDLIVALYSILSKFKWVICLILIFIYCYFMNIKAIGYSIVMKHDELRSRYRGLCPRCGAKIIQDRYRKERQEVMATYELPQVDYEYDPALERHVKREWTEIVPIYNTVYDEVNYNKCSNENCGYSWRNKLLFRVMPTRITDIYTMLYNERGYSFSSEPINYYGSDMCSVFKFGISQVKAILSFVLFLILVVIFILNKDNMYQLTEENILEWVLFTMVSIVVFGVLQIIIHKVINSKKLKLRKIFSNVKIEPNECDKLYRMLEENVKDHNREIKKKRKKKEKLANERILDIIQKTFINFFDGYEVKVYQVKDDFFVTEPLRKSEKCHCKPYGLEFWETDDGVLHLRIVSLLQKIPGEAYVQACMEVSKFYNFHNTFQTKVLYDEEETTVLFISSLDVILPNELIIHLQNEDYYSYSFEEYISRAVYELETLEIELSKIIEKNN